MSLRHRKQQDRNNTVAREEVDFNLKYFGRSQPIVSERFINNKLSYLYMLVTLTLVTLRYAMLRCRLHLHHCAFRSNTKTRQSVGRRLFSTLGTTAKKERKGDGGGGGGGGFCCSALAYDRIGSEIKDSRESRVSNST
jgi:hypothetical protein